MSRQEDIRAALDGLTSRSGILKPERVVQAARNRNSPLHACFEWNDSKAASAYRLEQARQLIRTYVIVEPAAPSQPVRAYVSLRNDRQGGGGYRSLASVVSNEELYRQLLADALLDLKSLQEKYSRLKELKRIFTEIEKLERQQKLKLAA
jgi:hypothetical protein